MNKIKMKWERLSQNEKITIVLVVSVIVLGMGYLVGYVVGSTF